MTERSLNSTPRQRVCATCGTRLGENATRCAVCGTEVDSSARARSRARGGQITLPLPIALALLAVFALLSAGLTFAATRAIGTGESEAVLTGTATWTPTPSQSPTITPTETPVPTFTPLPDIEYTVVEGDTCGGIAFVFNVSVRSIIEKNNLGSNCLIAPGQVLSISQPTPTASPFPTNTLEPAEATIQACPTVTYTVQDGDALISIAQNYNVSMDAIKEWNGMAGDNVFSGQLLIIPLCKRIGTPGPTSTPTPPPPYPAPNLLLPKDGEAFSLADDTVTLQWASVGEFRENEFYRVMVEDITEEADGSGRKVHIAFVTDTKFIVPSDFRPVETTPHVMRWWIEPVRLQGNNPSGEPLYISAGGISSKRVFTWSGAAPATTATP